MTGHDDKYERIAAFLDGAMSDAEADAFEAAMAADADLAAEVERLASNDELLREAFAVPETAPADDAMLERMGLAPSPEPDSAEPAPFPDAANDNPPLWRRWQAQLGGAVAAGLAFALTFSFTGSGGMSDIGSVLDSTPSGQIAALDSGASVSPILSFQSGDGRYCREFTYSGPDGDRGAIACRASDDWVVEAWGEGASELPDPGEIALASGAGEGSLDEAYARLEAGDPVTIDEEKSLIDGDWKASK